MAPDSPRIGIRQLERAEGWGMAVAGYSYVLRPRNVEEVAEAYAIARREGRPLALRGAGRSYGDAALNTDGILLDLSAFNRILAWDPATGIIDVEPGVTIETLWKTIIGAGWWPPVVPGTMFATLGGTVAANIHGKNNFAMGPIGDHVQEFDLIAPTGEQVTCARGNNADLFHAAIGGFGAFGVFTRIRLKMKKIYSGNLMVEPYPTRNLPEMFAKFEELIPESDYLVGWVDCIAGGQALGRGLIHRGLYLPPGADPEPAETLRVAAQELPSKIMGILPKSLTYLLARPFTNRLGVETVNTAKYFASRWELRGHRYRQSHAGFAFLLDYVPNWKWMYLPGGLIQYQSFVPADRAAATFEEILRRCQKANLPSFLGVTKRHRPDAFLLSHAVDGYSLALDFKVTQQNRQRLWALLHSLDDVVLDAGGRFYFAKDLTLTADRIGRIWPPETLAEFARLKQRWDPEGLLQSDLHRRLQLSASEQSPKR